MANLVHRQRAVRRRVQPGGLDGVIACLSPVGWLSAAFAVLWVVLRLQPVTDPGVLERVKPTDVGQLLVLALGEAAIVALPFAFELGYPRVRRLGPWLWRGAILLALSQLAEPVLDFARTWVSESLGVGVEQLLDSSTILGMAFTLLGILPGLLVIGGLWDLSTGLGVAGARPRRFVIPGVAAACVALTLYVFLPYLGQGLDMTTMNGWTNLAGLLLSLVQIALWIAVGVRLVFGGAMGLIPRSGWLVGLLAGLLILLLRFGNPVMVILGPAQGLGPVFSGVQSAMWILLLVAALEGLGRGTRRRLIRAPLVHLFVLNPTD